MFTRNLLTLILFVYGLNVQAQMTPTYNDILIPMRDTTFLEADVYLPSGPGPFEAILIQTPYDKDDFEWSLPMGVGQNVNGQPFAWIVVDWRGFYGSAAAVGGSSTKGEDGYDICEWIVAQTWHGSRIGTWGPSALGKIQYDLMGEAHPNHTCAVPLVAHPQQAYDDYFYGGVLEEARLQTLDALGYGLSPYIMANVYYSFIWQTVENNSWVPSNIKVPTLQIGGWYDHNIDKMNDWYTATRTGADPTVLDQQWFLVGPWVHGGTGAAYVGSSVQGELSYPNAEFVSDTMAWDFLNYYLLDAVNGWDTTPMITYYEIGNDQWLSTNANSLVVATNDVLYFDQNSTLRSTNGAGWTTFTSDPSNPSPTIGGANLHPSLQQGPYDQISLESRPDVITFTTGDLPSDVTITGRVKLNLFVEANQPDCDIAIRMVDVYPDNRNMLINDGIRRMRFRNGYTQADEAFMTPGNVYEVEIDLPFTNYTWKAGHEIKIYVSGNSSIRWNVNLQDGGTMYQTGTGNVADITVHHDALYPSSITLPGNNPILGIEEESMPVIGIYPVPASETLSINSESEIDNVIIYDLQGKKLIDTKQLNDIDISMLEQGVYIVACEISGKFIQRKFTKL